jgi:hypothetical protein
MSSPTGKTPTITPEDAARIQSASAKAHGGEVERGSFASRAQSAADRAAAAEAKEQRLHQQQGQGQQQGEKKST